jgi:hypothetical protein
MDGVTHFHSKNDGPLTTKHQRVFCSSSPLSPLFGSFFKFESYAPSLTNHILNSSIKQIYGSIYNIVVLSSRLFFSMVVCGVEDYNALLDVLPR